MDPASEGAVLSFDCPPQHILIGPSTTTCMGNGEWEPDPREVECKDIMLAITTGSDVHACKEYITGYGNVVNVFVGLYHNNTQDLESRASHETLIASSVVAFLVISILTLATGVACGYYFILRRRRKQSSSSNQPTEPLYEDVILNTLPQPSALEHQEQGLKLKENAAYGTAKPTDQAIDPLHHEALPSAVEYHLEQGLELTENVAYGTAKPTDPLHHEALSSAVEYHLEQDLELKENVAYGTAKPTDALHHETLPSAEEHHLEQGLELRENVAYGTAKPTDPLVLWNATWNKGWS